MDIADANLMGFQAVYVPKGKGFSAYRRWHKRIENKINKLLGINIVQETIWDRMSRNKRRSNNIN